jgi:hypothetical protein
MSLTAEQEIGAWEITVFIVLSTSRGGHMVQMFLEL